MDMEEEETEADATDRLTEEITERYDEQSDNLSDLLDQLEELSVPKIEIDTSGKVTWARYRIVKVSLVRLKISVPRITMYVHRLFCLSQPSS